MTKRNAEQWLENKGYRVMYQASQTNCDNGHYIAEGGTFLGRYTARTLNELVNIVKTYKRY